VARVAEKVINGRGKRGRKRKITAQEAEEPEPDVARTVDAPVPWRAPVARTTVARKNRESFLISLTSDLFFGGRISDTSNIHSILGAIEGGVIVRLQVISKQSLCRGQTLNSNL